MSQKRDSFRGGNCPLSEKVPFTQVYVDLAPWYHYMKKIYVISTLVLLCIVTCCIAGCSYLDPVVGTWESSLGTTTLDLSGNGEGMITVLGFSDDSITWKNLGDGVYNIGGSRYTLNGDTLEGAIVTYHKV